jgi:methylenetetrahydrofolate--tRNA-(uracil-5-)-methyltransferase
VSSLSLEINFRGEIMNSKEVIIVGAGLAGCEAAYQLAKRGIKVKLYEMKAKKMTEAHKKDYFAELVCSNSLGGDNLANASGLMKEELRKLDSLLIKIADKNRVPAGQALAVDRDGFSIEVTEYLRNMENIEIIDEEFTEIPEDKIILIASGPLTSEVLSKKIAKLTHSEHLYFYDAAAPIVTLESINMEKAYRQSRYGKGEGEYINCPMNKEEYYTFYNALITAERVPLKAFEEEKLFEACMPVERIAMTGERTLVFGPLKPKGLINPKTDKMDYAVVQLRQDDKDGKLYNIVGFQTNLKWGEQKRVFSMIPGLENAEFVRYGVMHRNTFIDSSKLLDETLKLKASDNIYFAGQITGSEGYVSSISTGAMAAINIAHRLLGKSPFILDDRSAIGAIIKYITEEKKNFQPMGPNFGIIRSLDGIRIKDKKERYNTISKIALEYLENKIGELA